MSREKAHERLKGTEWINGQVHDSWKKLNGWIIIFSLSKTVKYGNRLMGR